MVVRGTLASYWFSQIKKNIYERIHVECIHWNVNTHSAVFVLNNIFGFSHDEVSYFHLHQS